MAGEDYSADLDDQMSGWLIEGNTVIDAQMGIMVGGGRDTVVKNNNFIGCDKGLHIDNRGMRGEKPSCLGADLTGLKAAMSTPTWAKCVHTQCLDCPRFAAGAALRRSAMLCVSCVVQVWTLSQDEPE